jgi:hypothetical protein
MRRVLATTGALLLLMTGSLKAAEAPVKVLPTADPHLSSARAKPRSVEWLMTGDFFTHLRWSHWGSPHTSGRGTYNLNLCDPTCGGGPYKKIRGRITLSKIVTCRGVRLYTVASARYLTRGHWHKPAGLGEPSTPCT